MSGNYVSGFAKQPLRFCLQKLMRVDREGKGRQEQECWNFSKKGRSFHFALLMLYKCGDYSGVTHGTLEFRICDYSC